MNDIKNKVKKSLINPKIPLYYAYRKYILKRPYLFARQINKMYYENFCQPGHLDVMSEDWDTLLLIDACRYDYFAELSDLPGKLDDRMSPGSMSLEFIKKTFGGGNFHDTVYVTGNPFVMEIEADTFHDIVSLVDDYYNNEIGTIPPEDITAVAREAHLEYPHKRIIVHYMQPHEPFLSKFGQSVSNRLRWAGNQYHLSRDMSLSDLQRAYKENVEIILEELKTVIPEIEGKVVVSSDHGELLGERLFPVPIRGLEHPSSIYEKKLLQVPWLEIDADKRRRICSDPPKAQEDIASKTAKERLEQLGYL